MVSTFCTLPVDDSHFGYKQKFLRKSTIGLLVSYNSAKVNICIRLLVFYADYFLKKGVARSHLLDGTYAKMLQKMENQDLWPSHA